MTAGRAVTIESAARAATILVLLGAGFAATWARVAGEAESGAGSVLLFAAPVGAALTAVAVGWRRRPELPIHDRQSDKIVGTVVLAVALMIQWLVLPRYPGSYILLHLDVLAAWVYLLGACIFLFGLRRTSRYWPAWLVLVVGSPGAIRLAAFTLGGGRGAEIAVVCAVVFAGPLVVFARELVRGRPAERTRWRGPAVSPREAWRSVPLLVAVAVALWWAPLPAPVEERLDQGPPGPAEVGMVVPPGWIERSAQDFPWAVEMYGPGTTLHRQLIRATSVREDWDELSRLREAVVQTLTVPEAGLLDAYPIEMTYDLTAARVSPPTSVELGNGVTARYRTVVDDESLLTWSLMSFVWTRSPGSVQRVSILTVDNHEYDAVFPETVPGTASTAGRLVSLGLRGSASVTVTDPQQKDLAMLTELGTDLVEAQWTTR